MNPTSYIIEHCEDRLVTDEAPVWFLAIWSIFEARAFSGNYIKTYELLNHTARLDQNFVNLRVNIWSTIQNELRGIQNYFTKLQVAAKFDSIIFPSDFLTNNSQDNTYILFAAIYQLRNKLVHGQLYPSADYSNENSFFIQVNNMIHLSGIVCLKWVRLTR